MKIIDCEQYSDEWWEARRGLPTCSAVSRIITSTGKASKSADGYMNQLIAEFFAGPQESYKSGWMERGTELEPKARQLYELIEDCELEQAGLLVNDNPEIAFAGSPDSLRDRKSGIEIKCPAPHTHIQYLRDRKVPSEYVPQMQGLMLITGYQSWDFMSYCPGLPPLILTLNRDDAWISQAEALLYEFNRKMELIKNQLRENYEELQ